MKEIDIHVSLDDVQDHLDLVKMIEDSFKLNSGDIINFSINLNTDSYIYSDHLCLIAAVVKYLRSNGIKVNGKIPNYTPKASGTKYASRVNFFDHIGSEYEESFERHDPSGRFTEILEFNDDNAIVLHKKIMEILMLMKTCS